MSWQPIETAPKDGTPVLVLFRGRMYVAEFLPIFHPDNKRWAVREPPKHGEEIANMVSDIDEPKWGDGTPIPGALHKGPTHWMPLPPPPVEP